MGDKLSCVGSEKITSERRALENLYEWFSNVVMSTDGDEVKISKKKCKALLDSVAETLSGPKNKRSRVDFNSHSVQILNNRSSAASTMFIQMLKHSLVKGHNLEATVIPTLSEMNPENILVVICNQNQSGSPEKVASICLEGIQPGNYRQVILIVLHVARPDKLPFTPSRKLLSGTDLSQLGVIVDMGFENDEIYRCETNDFAFEEIKKFCSSYERPNIVSDMQTIGKLHPQEENQNSSFQNSDKVKRVRDSVKPKVFIIDPSNTDATKDFMKVFESRMQQTGIEVEQKQSDDAKDVEPDSVLIVVCNAVSRIKSDIEKCLHPVLQKVYSRHILIVLHVVRKGKEPTFGSTKKKLESSSDHEKYASLGTIIDIAFNKDDGIYECPMNEKALADLKNVFAEI